MTEQPQPPPAPEQRPLWKLDRGEQRVLFVTFVGGVASIVVAAMVGGAIALGHVYRNLNARHAAGFAEGGKIYGYVMGSLIALKGGWLWLLFTDRLLRLLVHRVVGRITLVLLAVFSLVNLVIMLTVIGLGAGVK
jgi:hypothetical protein